MDCCSDEDTHIQHGTLHTFTIQTSTKIIGFALDFLSLDLLVSSSICLNFTVLSRSCKCSWTYKRFERSTMLAWPQSWEIRSFHRWKHIAIRLSHNENHSSHVIVLITRNMSRRFFATSHEKEYRRLTEFFIHHIARPPSVVCLLAHRSLYLQATQSL